MSRKDSGATLPSPLEAATALFITYMTEYQTTREEAFKRVLEMLGSRFPELTPLQARLVARAVELET